MKLFVTIAEETQAGAVAALGAVGADHDGVEFRVEKFAGYDPVVLRRATAKPVMLTRRGSTMDAEEIRAALAARIDLLDVEARGDMRWIEPYRDRVVLSHHDFEGMPAVAALLAEMRAFRPAHVKLAVTPRSFADNLELLRHASRGTTLIGMGERGLFSRIVAPFLGSELVFVAPGEPAVAAPAQLTLDQALQIYGSDRGALMAERVFAVVGNPAGHSLSPVIHNPLFRARGVPAAYTIASVESFDEVAPSLLDGTLSGLSVTAPFKKEAYKLAVNHAARIGENAAACHAANTLVNAGGRLIADNTDVDAFSRILARLCGRDAKTVALVGAGGTARAASVALRRAGMRTIVFNRSEEQGRALAQSFGATFEPLAALGRFDGEIIINALTRGTELQMPLRPGMTYVEAAYGGDGEGPPEGVEFIDGMEILRLQAERQHELFMKVFSDAS